MSSHQNGKEFAEVIEHFDGISFYKHIKAGYNTIVTTYLYKSDSSNNIISFSKNYNKFKEVALPIFGEVKTLRTKILSKKMLESDIPLMVKLLKYKHKFDRNENIYYNSFWDEVDDEKKAEYYAKIESIEDSLFHLKYYFKSNIPIYEGDFSSFYPSNKQGDFKWYYPNGDLRRIVNYTNDKVNEINTFYKDSIKHYEYRKYNEKFVFDKVFPINDNVKIDSLGNGLEQFYDSITGKQINYFYKNKKMYKAFYLDSTGKKIYQKCDVNAGFKNIKAENNRIALKVTYPEKSLKNYSHGVVYVKCIVEPTGIVSDIQIIKKLDSNCDSLAKSIVDYFKEKNRFKPAKNGKEKVTQEIVIPIVFSIESFSRYRNYNNYNLMNQMMHQQQMMNQQMMNQQMMRMSTPMYRF